jgi:hypothetical protein
MYVPLRGEEIICNLSFNQRSVSWDSFGVVGQISRASFICPPIPATSHTPALCVILSDNMRFLISIYLLGQSFVVCGQKPYNDKRLPFQVLFADNVENKKGQPVKNFDLISINDVLVVGQGGFLSMVHYFGYPIEIDRDTTINIKELQKEFDLLKLGKRREKYSNLKRPDIEFLNITDSDTGRKSKFKITKPCHHCSDFELIYPPKYRANEILFDNELCLKWESTGSNSYMIELKNMFDESVMTYTATTNELKLDDRNVRDVFDRERVLLLSIKDESKNRASDISIIRKFTSQYKYPYSCTPQTATDALFAGFYIEVAQGNHGSEAEGYYQLAMKLSDRQLFKTMYDNFIKRHQR